MTLDILLHTQKLLLIRNDQHGLLLSQLDSHQNMLFPQNAHSVADKQVKKSHQEERHTREIPRILHREQIQNRHKREQTHVLERSRKFLQIPAFEHILERIQRKKQHNIHEKQDNRKILIY